jgi:hypothetical protein
MKTFFIWLKDAIIELLNQNFTLLGFFVVWVLLEGSARTLVGWVTVASVLLHLITMYVRDREE